MVEDFYFDEFLTSYYSVCMEIIFSYPAITFTITEKWMSILCSAIWFCVESCLTMASEICLITCSTLFLMCASVDVNICLFCLYTVWPISSKFTAISCKFAFKHCSRSTSHPFTVLFDYPLSWGLPTYRREWSWVEEAKHFLFCESVYLHLSLSQHITSCRYLD